MESPHDPLRTVDDRPQLSMTLPQTFKKSLWDSAALGVDAFEISDPLRENLELAVSTPGHYTVRVAPRAPKQLLHEYGFYYCDTLIEPHCTPGRFIPFDNAKVSITQDATLKQLLEICHGAFSHDRFHRDFNVALSQADQRYDNWLSQLHSAGHVYGLLYRSKLIGFIAVNGGRLVLHAVAESLRGKDLAKYLWTPVCLVLFDQGHEELTSSISASNLAATNLYTSLGFRFRNPSDIYHLMTP